ncbi:MAG: transposase domain-containing protein [bacterium]|nr:transposase domain-containing protein [bacterium]
MIETTKFNTVDPQTWLTDVHAHIVDHMITKLDGLMS